MLLLLLACGADPASATAAAGTDLGGGAMPVACATAPGVTWENWGQGFFMTRCGSCHTPTAQDRHGAPEGVDFVTHAQMLSWADEIHATVIEEGTMPLGGGLGDEDLALLETLITCGS